MVVLLELLLGKSLIETRQRLFFTDVHGWNQRNHSGDSILLKHTVEQWKGVSVRSSVIIGVLRSLEVALGSLVLVHGIPSFAIFVVQSITADFDFQGPVDVPAAFCS